MTLSTISARGCLRARRAVIAAIALGSLAFTMQSASAQQSPSADASRGGGQVQQPAPAVKRMLTPAAAAEPVQDSRQRFGPTSVPESDISVLVVAGEETTLSSQMAGKIKRVRFGLGDSVARGAVLIEFDCSEQEAQIQAAQAEYRGLRETHLAKMKLQALGAAGELEVTVAAAAADKARSQVDLRESQVAYCSVQAPFSGNIARLRVKTAESVNLGQPLIELLNTSSLKAQMFVPANLTGVVLPGTVFQVRIDDGKVFRARVAKTNSRVEGVSQQLEIEGKFEGPTRGLLPGMVGTAIFPARPKR
jgi:membrane fusion protein (multidrug efflux system)